MNNNTDKILDGFHGGGGEHGEWQAQQAAEANWTEFYTAFKALEAQHRKPFGGYSEEELTAWHKARAALEKQYGETVLPHMTDVVEFRTK